MSCIRGRYIRQRGFGVPDHPFDRRKAAPQGTLQLVDAFMCIVNAQSRRHTAMEVDDLAFVGPANANVMHLADEIRLR